jgi:NADPH:quinone reductase-like Zn-dependent oxidoreductase
MEADMLSVAVTRPDEVKVVDIPEPIPGPYEARIRTEMASLCNSTDRKLIEGHFPGVEKYPLLLGHEAAGVVDAIGAKVRSFKKGDRVIGGLLLNVTDKAYSSGWGGFSEYVIAGDHQAMLEDGVADANHGWFEVYEIMRVVPPSISIEAAVLLCTWREVYAAFGDFNLKPQDAILVYGAGPVGLSFVKFAHLMGMKYIGVVEYAEEKRKLALTMGANEVFAPDDTTILKIPEKRGQPLDAVIDAVGRENIINAALPLIKMGGSICVYGVIDQPAVTIQKSKGPYNFNLYVHQWPTRAREAAAQAPLCEWLQSGRLKPKEFISAVFPIQKVNEAFTLSKTGTTIKTILTF